MLIYLPLALAWGWQPLPAAGAQILKYITARRPAR